MIATDIEMPPPARTGVGRPGPSCEEAAAVMRAAGFEPLVPYPGKADLGWKSRCLECSKTTLPRLGKVRAGTARCKHCSRRESRERQIAARIDIVMATMRAADLQPLEPFTKANAKWRCLCMRCKREVTPTLETVQRSRSGIGCSYCNGGATHPDDADRVMREAGFEPLEPFPGNVYTDWAYRCLECNYEGSRPFFNTKTNGYGCPACADRRNRVDAALAVALMREHGYEPLTDFPGSREPWACLCTRCGQEGAPAYNRVTQGRGAGCCNTRVDLTRPGHAMGLYIVTHRELDAMKVGIGLTRDGRSERIVAHEKRGWLLQHHWLGYPSLRHALDVERAVLQSWRSLGHLPHVAPADTPQRGHTETVQWSAVALDVVVDQVVGLNPEGVLLAAVAWR